MNKFIYEQFKIEETGVLHLYAPYFIKKRRDDKICNIFSYISNVISHFRRKENIDLPVK